MNSEWLYNGEVFDSSQSDGYFGFIYCITHIPSGKMYIGRKYFTKAAQKQVKGKKKKIRKTSDWENYYGSSADLLADVEKYGKEAFKREILHLCKTRGMTNYMELQEMIDRRVLSENYYNSWISAKIHRSSVKSNK